MLKQSSFISESSQARIVSEEKYYIVFLAALFVCGILLLLIPAFDKNGIIILVAGWVLLATFTLDVLRPLFYSRGVADAVMVILTGSFYAVLEYSIGTAVSSIENFRLLICIALFLAGISRVLAFARMIVVVNLPLMPICGVSEMIVSIMLFFEWPGSGTSLIYWLLGMTVILSGFESLTEAAKLNA